MSNKLAVVKRAVRAATAKKDAEHLQEVYGADLHAIMAAEPELATWPVHK